MSDRIKGTTIRPTCNTCGSPKPTNYIQMVNDILATPSATMDPNSTIYQNALNQFNDALRKGTTQRLSVPKGFCGYIDPTSGQFRVTPEPDITLLHPNERLTVPGVLLPVTTSLAPSSYPIDECLASGRPGSKPYADCSAGKLIEISTPYYNWGDVYNGMDQPEMTVLMEEVRQLIRDGYTKYQDAMPDDNGGFFDKIIPVVIAEPTVL